MSDGEDAEYRLADLESRFVHTERALQDLSDVTRQQWAEIDGLKLQVERLKDRITELDQGGSGAGRLEDERPPHY